MVYWSTPAVIDTSLTTPPSPSSSIHHWLMQLEDSVTAEKSPAYFQLSCPSKCSALLGRWSYAINTLHLKGEETFPSKTHVWPGFWNCLMWPVFICFPYRRRRALYSPPHDSSNLNSKEQRCQDLSVTWLTILWEQARQFISPTSYSQKPWNCFVWKIWGEECRLNSHNYIKYSVHLISCCQHTKI